MKKIEQEEFFEDIEDWESLSCYQLKKGEIYILVKGKK